MCHDATDNEFRALSQSLSQWDTRLFAWCVGSIGDFSSTIIIIIIISHHGNFFESTNKFQLIIIKIFIIIIIIMIS